MNSAICSQAPSGHIRFAIPATSAPAENLIWPEGAWLQIALFIVTSVATLILTRPYARRLREKKNPTNADRNIGAEAVVTSTITKHEPGAVKVNGMVWTAVSQDGSTLSEGDVVIVKSISGVKMTVAAK